MKKILTYLISGLFFLLVMEFMFQVQILNNFVGFLMTPIIEIPFLLFAYFSSKLIDRLTEKSRFKEIAIYIIYGLIGLFFIEWLYAGNSPMQNPDANQFIMFSYWGGAVIFSRIFIDKDKTVKNIKKWILKYFIIYSTIAIFLGFLIPAQERLCLIVLIAIAGYGFMNIFYIWYFAKKFLP